MTPIYLNPPPPPFPLLELKEDQHLQLFSTPHHDAASSHSSCPIIFNIAQDQRESNPRESQQHEQKADKYISHGGSSDCQVFPSSSVKPVVNDSNNGHKLSVCKREDADENMSYNGSLKWMTSKMRLMRKMNSICTGTDEPVRIVQKFHDHQQQDSTQINSSNNSNEIIRVCTDCNTTKTPLWRSGPQGPKSLCNACGIRQRKARRAMAAAAAAAANGTVLASDTSSTTTKVHKKEKKLRTNCVAQYKKQCKLHSPPHSRKKICFEDFAPSMNKNSSFQRVFPQDEEEAAILLMALSCGLIHS